MGAACGASSAGPLNHDTAQALIDRAGQLEAGNLLGAEKAYLECLEWCPLTLRAFAGSRLHDIAGNRAQVDLLTEAAVSRIEDRVVSGEPSSEEFLGDVVALTAVYEQWSKPERVEKLLATIQVQSGVRRALLSAQRADAARSVVRMAAAGVRVDGCEKLVGEIEAMEWSHAARRGAGRGGCVRRQPTTSTRRRGTSPRTSARSLARSPG